MKNAKATLAKCKITKLKPFGALVSPEPKIELKDFTREDLLEFTRIHKILLFRGFPVLAKEELLKLCSNNPDKDLLHWSFGPVMEMKEMDDPKNYLFSREKVPYHWDGAFHTVPSYLVFNCIDAPFTGCGGETLFCNTEMIWQKASAEQKKLWNKVELEYETEKKAHYGGKIKNPLVQKHPHMDATILRYAESVETKLNPVFMKVHGLNEKEQATFLADMQRLIYSDNFCYKHEWQTGDLLIADNHGLIHGRTAFAKESPRHLRRIQIL